MYFNFLKRIQMKKYFFFYLIILILSLINCRGRDGVVGSSGLNSLIETTEEPSGVNCANGGLKVDTGLDANDNGFLEVEEVLKTDYVCSDLIRDKQISFRLKANVGAYGTTPELIGSNLPFFDIENYIGVDSAIFTVSGIRTIFSDGRDATSEGTFELYDLTNNQVIANSTIVSDDIDEFDFIASDNIIENIPKQAIKLGIRITSKEAVTTDCREIFLILFRK